MPQATEAEIDAILTAFCADWPQIKAEIEAMTATKH